MIRVRITRPSDGKHPPGAIVDLDEFLDSVRYVLENGGEMPIAVVQSEFTEV